MKYKILYFILSLILLSILLSCSTHNIVPVILKDSSFQWQHIKLDNFRIHYRSDQNECKYINELTPILKNTLNKWLLHSEIPNNSYKQIFDIFIMKEKKNIQRYTREWIGHAELIPNNGIILLQDSATGDFLEQQLYRLFLMNKYNGNQTNSILHHPCYQWTSIETESFILYQNKGDYPQRDNDSLISSVKKTIDYNLDFLGISNYPFKLNLFFVPSRVDIQNLCGHAYGGQQIEGEHTLLMVDNSERSPAINHEMNHIFAYEIWGEPKQRGFIPEGIAVASHHLCISCNYTNHQIAANLLEKDKLPELQILENDFWSFDDMISYFTAGSFMYFLRTKYGAKAFKILWKNGLNDGANILGTSFQDLEREWLYVIENTPPAGDEYYEQIINSGCE